jgi:hypothetical protein
MGKLDTRLKLATLKLHTYLLFPIDFNSGSPPKFPTIITLLIPAVEKYFEDPEDEVAIKGFEGAKKWATENNIKEVLEQISIYEKALKDVEDDDEAVHLYGFFVFRVFKVFFNSFFCSFSNSI